MSGNHEIVPIDRIERRILQIRGERVIVDADLAGFYGVPTRRLNEQVRRNEARFPRDFVFQLTADEKSEVIANCDHLGNLKFSKALPLVFTEHGAIMAANVLSSPRAIEMGVFVVRAFVNLRRAAASHQALARRLDGLERQLAGHDAQLVAIVQAIRSLLSARDVPKKRRIGFDRGDP